MVLCLYYKIDRNNRISFILLHVDDMNGLFPRDGVERERVKFILEKKYDALKEQRGDEVMYIGMEVRWNASGKKFEIGMIKYIEKVALRYGIEKGVTNPNSHRTEYIGEDNDPIDDTEYRSLIGAIRYMAMLVKPVALYMISVLSTKQGKAKIGDYKDALRVLKYLFHTRHERHIINACGRNNVLHIWCDASYGNYEDGHSVESIVVKLGECKGAVYVGSWKQKAIAGSVGNAEVMSLTTGVQYGRYFHDVFEEIDERFKMKVKYYEDNQSTYDMVVGDATCNILQEKFMRIRIAKLHEYWKYNKDEAEFIKVPTEEMVADVGTKQLYGAKFKHAEVLLNGNY